MWRALAIAVLLVAASACLGVTRTGSLGENAFGEDLAWRDFRARPEEVCDELFEVLALRGFEPRLQQQGACVIAGEGLWAAVEALPADLARVRLRVGTMRSERERSAAAEVLDGLALRVDGTSWR